MKRKILEYQQDDFIRGFMEDDILKETPKAYLIDATPDYSEKGLAWVPKSIVKKHENGVYVIPFWFSQKELSLRVRVPQEVWDYYYAAKARLLKQKETEMKLTEEDIDKYATDEEKKILKEWAGKKVMDWKVYAAKLKDRTVAELYYMRKDAHEAALAGDDLGKAGLPNNAGYYWDEVHMISDELRKRREMILKKPRMKKIPLDPEPELGNNGEEIKDRPDYEPDRDTNFKESRELNEEKTKRKVGEMLLSWDGGYFENEDTGESEYDDFAWDDVIDELSGILQKKNKSGDWYAKVKGFGWRGMDGENHFEATTGQKFLNKILPDTDCHFKIYDYGKNGLAINNFHHDSPTGTEWYYVVPNRYKKDLYESKQINEKKYGSLYVSQQKILDAFIKKNAGKLGLNFSIDDYPNLYDAIEAIHDAETLWQDINGYVHDNYGKFDKEEGVHTFNWGDSVDHLMTDDDREGLTEAINYKPVLKLKESVSEQRVANIIKYTDEDLDKWEAMMGSMSRRELHDAEFDLKSAIAGINHNFKTYHIRKMQNEYWDGLKERRQLYRRYLNRLKKYYEKNPRQSLRDKEKEDLYFNHVSHDTGE